MYSRFLVAVTVISHVALTFSDSISASVDVAVIVVVPKLNAVTTPAFVTVATLSFDDSHAKVLFPAFAGETVATIVYCPPSTIAREDVLRVIDSTRMFRSAPTELLSGAILAPEPE